jgi:pimeloyl-ACP methyl ester carboxylesterase
MRLRNVLYWCVILLGCVETGTAGSSLSTPRIDESSYVRLGGIDQFVSVHGADGANPILLLVHGGPGDVQSPFRDQYEGYEQHYVLVQWDQRGAGKTYGRHKDRTPNLTLDQIVADGIELTRYLEQHFHRKKIWLLGHSWGSVVGVQMAQRRPELFSAYIGTGQVGSWRRGILYQREFVLKRASEVSNQEAIDAIQHIADFDPANVQHFLTGTVICAATWGGR